jgi:hypothetical protein
VTSRLARLGYAGSIREEEIRSLIAESRGDFAQAARSREAEIRKILQLHTLSVNTPGWEYVARQYDFSDVSDRLDLLAILYDELGDLDRAIATLRESKQYCESHEAPFDGQGLLDELEQAREKQAARSPRRVDRDQLDDFALVLIVHSRSFHCVRYSNGCAKPGATGARLITPSPSFRPHQPRYICPKLGECSGLRLPKGEEAATASI